MRHKILHIVHSLSLGGAQTVLQQIVDADLDNKDVYVYALKKANPRISIEHKNVFENQSTSKYSFGPLFEIKSLVEKEQIDVLHVHGISRSILFANLLKTLWFKDIKIIIHEHGRIFGSESFNKVEDFLYEKIFKYSLKKINCIIAVSYATKQELIKQLHADPNKVTVVYNSVDLEKYKVRAKKELVFSNLVKFNSDDFVIGVASRLTKMKGLGELIEALKILLPKYTQLKVLIAGHGPMEHEFEAFINEHNYQDRVFLIGYYEDMPRFYKFLDLFVNPSYWESFGLSAIEAQATGVPVLATNVRGLNEIVIEGETGFVCEAQNSKALVTCIENAIQDKTLRAKFVENSIRHISNFALIDNYQKLLGIYSWI